MKVQVVFCATSRAISSVDLVGGPSEPPGQSVALALSRKGEYEAAIERSEQLTPVPAPPGYFQLELACLFSVAAKHAADTNADRSRELADRALEYINQSREAGFLDTPLGAHSLRINPDLEFIRGRLQ